VSLCLSGAPVFAQQWPSEGPPRPLAARDVKFPPYQLQTLPNGLQVVAVLHHEQPVVSMRLLVRAGGSSDPKAKLGLARLGASLLDQGTTTVSAQELADAIDFIGGAMGTGAGTDLSYLNMIVMKDSFEAGLRMLSDMARHPAYAQHELDRQRQQILSGLRVSLEDPDYVANAVFDRLVYGFHPYGLPQTGTPDTIKTITRDDLVAFHQKYFAPNNAILAVVGDVTAEEAFAEVRKVFGDWERHDVPPMTFSDPPEPTRRVVVVNKPDAVQTEVRVGNIGVPRKSPDYMALNLAVRVLGGEGSNRLHQVLRTERGLTYGAQASFDTLKWSGDIEAQTNTRSEATGEVLRLIVDEFWRLQRERVGERELADAKAYLSGSFPLTIETPDQIAMQVLNVLFYDLPVEQLQTFRDRVNAVTVDDVQRVARAYLKPDNLSVVLVGNAAAFARQLPGVGFGKFETVELGNLDLTAADFKQPKRAAAGAGERPRPASSADARDAAASEPGGPASREESRGWAPAASREESRAGRGGWTPAGYRLASQQATGQPPAPAITPEEGTKAKALLDRVIAAKGGLEKLRGIKSIIATTRTTAANGQAPPETTTYLQYPNRVHIETRIVGAASPVTIVQVYDGERAWVRNPDGVFDVPAPRLKDMQTGLKRDTIALLLAAASGEMRARILPDVKDDAGKVYQALELSDATLDPMVLYVDPATALIAKQSYVAGAPGQPIIEERFGEYRPIDGIQIAFNASVRRGGQPLLERRVLDIKINTPIDPALFKRPSP
jgi:zinc protease